MLVATNNRINVDVTVTLRRHKLYINHTSVCWLTFFTGVSISRNNDVTLLVELNITQDALEFIYEASLCGSSISRKILSRNTGYRDTSKLTLNCNSFNGLKVVQVLIRGVSVTDNRSAGRITVNAGSAVVKALTARDIVLLVAVGTLLIHTKNLTSLLIYLKARDCPRRTRSNLTDTNTTIRELRAFLRVLGVHTFTALVDYLKPSKPVTQKRKAL